MPPSLRVAAVTLALLAAGCQDDGAPAIPFGCTDDAPEIVRALDAAPEAVRLSDGTSISTCLKDADSEADLQNVGVALSTAAEELEAATLDGDADAGLKLGYLVGAAQAGAKRNIGLSAELLRRLERSIGYDAEPDVDAAIERGLEAGARLG